MAKKENKNCFVIMPISDPEGYEQGHFERVYQDIIIPAVDKTDFNAIRADDVKETNFIHLDILKKLIDAPIAICDLSSRNPNVLFELGIRQAFDKPTVLIQEEGTPKIFDIGPIRVLEYSAELKYRDVLEIQAELAVRIKATKEAEGETGNINSIVRLMALDSPASVPKLGTESKEALTLDVLQSEVREIRKILNGLSNNSTKPWSTSMSFNNEYNVLSKELDYVISKLNNNDKIVKIERIFKDLNNIRDDISVLRFKAKSNEEKYLANKLLDRVSKLISDFKE